MTMLRRRTPFETIRPFESLRDFMDMLNEPFNQVGEIKPYTENSGGILPVDVSEKDNEYIIRASLPGFTKDDIDVQVHEGVVTIKAEHSEEDERKDEKFYCRERRWGSVSRSITLPGIGGDVDTKAEFKDGVLTLHVPQSPAMKPKKVKIA